MQTMLRLVGFGDNAGSGIPSILAAWEEKGWAEPELIEDTGLDQVTLVLKMTTDDRKKYRQSADSADSADFRNRDLSDRQRQILKNMEEGILYSTNEIAEAIGLKGPRTRQLLNELVKMEILECTATTKKRRYIRRKTK